MEIVKFKKKKNNLYEVIFNNETSLNLYDETIIKYNLLANKKVSNSLLKEILTFNNFFEAYYKAIKYLNIKLRTRQEIAKYLRKYDFEEELIKKVIRKLEDEKYIDDDIYLQAYINDQVNLSLKGPFLIKRELLKLGFKEDKIDAYLNKIMDEIWLDKITKIIGKKIKANHNLSTQVLKIKTKQYLINQGYESKLINLKIDKILVIDEKDILQKEIIKEYRKLSRKLKDEELKNKIR